jgi:2-polyprenyl-3-methyl-5-hydroxy-6-metoxy-1,4-benzoquinol methylase
MNTAEILKHLVCPLHKCKLKFDESFDHYNNGVPYPDIRICCPEGHEFEIQRGILRFVSSDNYASSFGLQWQKYQKTQLDSYTGQSISRRRPENSLNMPLEALKEKVVLEAGCGAGRFTELLIDKCKLLVSMDFSHAVDANLKNCGGKTPYVLIQADINKSPLPQGFFDIVICLGVIQHTPSPEQTIASLAKHVKPGGLLVIDHYTNRNRFSLLGRVLSLKYPLRAILKRLRPELSLKITTKLTAIADPIRKLTYKKIWLDRIVVRLLPTICYYDTYPELKSEILCEWNELDTFDSLTDYYKHFRSPKAIEACLKKLGLININVLLGGNGVIARGIRPH